MSRRLVSLNPDLGRLVEAGYAVAFDRNHLVVRDIPYLDQRGELQRGAFVTALEFVTGDTVRQVDHQVFFAGAAPYELNGSPIPNLGGGSARLELSDRSADVVVERTFSNKPRSGAFADFFEKIDSYTTIIAGPAMQRFGVTPRTGRVLIDDDEESVFKLPDTNTSRAGISALAALFQSERVAIIGLGGTGSYVLDLMVKTPVAEIRAFDADTYCVHNTYRSPGRMDLTELGRSKADVLRDRYQNVRRGLLVESRFIDAASALALDGVTFAFVCVDKGSSRSEIFDLLIGLGIPFIDVGMGLKQDRGALRGLVRTSHISGKTAADIRSLGLIDLSHDDDDIYRTNIQIAELNALNAAFAVLQYKRLRGFYAMDETSPHAIFDVADRITVFH